MNWVTVQKAIQNWIVAGSGLAANKVVWEGQNQAPRPAPPFIGLNLLTLGTSGRDWANMVDNPLVVADIAVDAVTFAADTMTIAAHGRTTGDGPFQWTSTVALPGGMSLATDYWLVVVDAATVKLTTTFAFAMAAVPTILDLAHDGFGTHTMTDTADTVAAGEECLHTARGTRTAVISAQCYAATSVGASAAVQTLNDAMGARVLPSIRDALVTAGVGVAGIEPITYAGGSVGSGSSFEPRAVTTIRIFLAQESTETGTYIESADDPVGTVT